MTHSWIVTDLYQVQQAGAMEHLCHVMGNHVWVVGINFSQEDQGGNICSTSQISTVTMADAHDTAQFVMATTE